MGGNQHETLGVSCFCSSRTLSRGAANSELRAKIVAVCAGHASTRMNAVARSRNLQALQRNLRRIAQIASLQEFPRDDRSYAGSSRPNRLTSATAIVPSATSVMLVIRRTASALALRASRVGSSKRLKSANAI